MNQEFNFATKTILVTGASSGIGRATAILFLRHARRLFDDDESLPAISNGTRSQRLIPQSPLTCGQ
jgi:NAD(P)-dependent dehydrogenase (short-subunit alcohol dehydrogenase family)